MAYFIPTPADQIAPAEVPEVELYHPKSWVTKYVFSQDAKVIAIQYAFTAIANGLVALVLSWLMRLQLGFPDAFSFIGPESYLQLVTMQDRKSVVEGKSVSVRVDHGGRRTIKKKKGHEHERPSRGRSRANMEMKSTSKEQKNT